MARLRIQYIHVYTFQNINVLYLHTNVLGCKYSDQNMQALMTESAVFSMNSKLECRGICQHIPDLIGLEAERKIHRGRTKELEKGEGGAPQQTLVVQ